MTFKQFSHLSAVLLLCISSKVIANPSIDPSQRLLQMLDYVGVDYPPTIQNGKIVDEVEFQEMLEFSGEILNLIAALPDSAIKPKLKSDGEKIRQLIEIHAEGDAVANLTRTVKHELIDAYSIIVAPSKIPSMENVQAVFDANCVSCHGTLGYGDGPLAKGMEPPPGDFHNMSRQHTRSIYDLYNTITLGVSGTPMPSFQGLSEDDRWALAFKISGYPTSNEQRENGKNLWQQGILQDYFQSLDDLTGTPFALAAEVAQHSDRTGQDGIDILAYLRSQPDVLNVTENDAIDISIEKLLLSINLLEEGNRKEAHKMALSAYLDGFELAEASLSISNKILKSQIEKEMITFRQLVKSSDISDVKEQRDVVIDLLIQAKKEINETTVSPAAAFVGSFVILLREGVEAILVLAAIMAALIKTGRREAMKYIHVGWVGAVLLGVFTWWAANNLITISGASREITEGVAALCAALILIYVGFWLHNASHSKRWKQFVEHKVDNAMEGKTLWVLASVAFIAVYREIFETILFYQAMWVQLENTAHHGFVFGIISAAVLLVVLAFVILRAGTKLPIKLFFQVNAVLLFMLAVVFSGQGIAALQEAGIIGINAIDAPTISYLGMYPTTEGLGLQLFVLVLGMSLLLYQKKSQ